MLVIIVVLGGLCDFYFLGATRCINLRTSALPDFMCFVLCSASGPERVSSERDGPYLTGESFFCSF